MLVNLALLKEFSILISDFWGYQKLDCLDHLTNYLVSCKRLSLLKLAIDDECEAIDSDGTAHFVDLFK